MTQKTLNYSAACGCENESGPSVLCFGSTHGPAYLKPPRYVRIGEQGALYTRGNCVRSVPTVKRPIPFNHSKTDYKPAYWPAVRKATGAREEKASGLHADQAARAGQVAVATTYMPPSRCTMTRSPSPSPLARRYGRRNLYLSCILWRLLASVLVLGWAGPDSQDWVGFLVATGPVLGICHYSLAWHVLTAPGIPMYLQVLTV